MVFDAHDKAFAFFGGACTRGIYDNMKTAVDAIFVGRERPYNRRFQQMCGHYLVDPVACTPASGWEKGRVENLGCGVEDAPRAVRQQQVLGGRQRRPQSGRDPRLRRAHRDPAGGPCRRRARPRLPPWRHDLPFRIPCTGGRRPAQLRDKAQGRTGRIFPIIAIREAGPDGFWIHRALENAGIESHVVDPASIATSSRRRRAKTDRLDGETLVRTSLAFKRGEPRVCAMVRTPHPEDEDRRRIMRERKALIAERVAHVKVRRERLRETAPFGCSDRLNSRLLQAILPRLTVTKNFPAKIVTVSRPQANKALDFPDITLALQRWESASAQACAGLCQVISEAGYACVSTSRRLNALSIQGDPVETGGGRNIEFMFRAAAEAEVRYQFRH